LFRPSVAPRAAFAQIPTLFLLQSLMRFMFLGNLIGFPAIVLPTRLGANNLPLSVQVHACATLARPIFTRSLRLLSVNCNNSQFMSAPWQEALLFRIAAALEVAVPKPPKYWDFF
jgi:Asp-tRNA(Asn)/Glu-tRNA(Gln) amidotransferase A subunit family amidase